MKRILKLILLTLISFTFYASFKPTSVNAVITPDNNGNWYWGYESELDESYYSDLTGVSIYDKEAFKKALHIIISTGCDMGSYKDAKTSLQILDEDPNDPNSILCIYTGTSILKSNFASSSVNSYWNREHVWAKSYGFPSESYDAYSDIHHLRACQMGANSRRNNRGFDDITGGETDIYGSTILGSDWYEPRAEVKGDVARIMMYMEVRYTGDSLSDGLKLTLTNDTNLSTSSGNGKLGKLDTLIKWHEEDPVDDLERQRNDKAYDIQGNRNPFVDHPEYANYIFGANYEVDNLTGLTVTYRCDSDTTFNYSDDNIYESGNLVSKPNVTPVKEGYNFIGWYSDSKLTNEWDFSSNKIYYDLVLYPKFELDINAIDAFKLLDIETKMFVKAMAKDTGSMVSNKLTLSNFNGDGSVSGKNKTIDLKDCCEFDDTLFDITYHTNNNQNGYIGGSGKQLRLYVGSGSANGSSVEISVIDGLRITNVAFESAGYDRVSASDIKINISSDGKTATIQNTNSGNGGHAKISSIEITYEEMSASYEIEGVKFAFHYLISNSLYEELLEIDNNIKFGFEIDGNKKDVSINNNEVFYQVDDIQIDQNVRVRGYLLINNEYVYTNYETHSVQSLANAYLTELAGNQVIIDNRGLLTYLSQMSSKTSE